VAVPKPADRYRVLVLGDSFSFGWGVELKDAWHTTMARELQAPDGRTLEVVDAGVPGWTPLQEFVFLEQRATGTLQIWAEPFTELRFPKLFNLKTDPYERADITSNTYFDWVLDHIFLFVPAQAYVARMIASLAEFPARQKPASFNVEQVMAKLQGAAGGE